MKKSIDAFIGVGSNLGDPIQNIVDARRRLYALATTLEGKCSSMYSSSPVGYAEQPDFVNCVVQIRTTDSAPKLLISMQKIELELGRARDPLNQNAARTIDLDMLLYGDESIEQPQLVLPHPRMTQRLFVLEPLLQLIPAHPLLGDIATLLRHVGDIENQTLQRLEC